MCGSRRPASFTSGSRPGATGSISDAPFAAVGGLFGAAVLSRVPSPVAGLLGLDRPRSPARGSGPPVAGEGGRSGIAVGRRHRVRRRHLAARHAVALLRAARLDRLDRLRRRRSRPLRHLLRGLRRLGQLARTPFRREPAGDRGRLGRLRVRPRSSGHRQPLGSVHLFPGRLHAPDADRRRERAVRRRHAARRRQRGPGLTAESFAAAPPSRSLDGGARGDSRRRAGLRRHPDATELLGRRADRGRGRTGSGRARHALEARVSGTRHRRVRFPHRSGRGAPPGSRRMAGVCDQFLSRRAHSANAAPCSTASARSAPI